mgnify:CR=1 FL=1
MLVIQIRHSAKTLDVLGTTRLLPTKLIAWICDDLHSLLIVLLSQLNKALIVLIGQASLGGHIGHEYNLLALTKISHLIDLLPINRCARHIEEVLPVGSLGWLFNLRARRLEGFECFFKWPK